MVPHAKPTQVDQANVRGMVTLPDRRSFLQHTACGLGAAALSQLLAEDGFARSTNEFSDPLHPRSPHFQPRAKRVIFLFMAGAPSQVDLFTPKPAMRRLHEQPIPASFLEGLDDSVLKANARVFASPRTFSKHGDCGMDFSDYLPNLATCADEVCMIRSVTTDTANHHPGQLLMNCGQPVFGLPSMGSWLSYGLGSECRDLPGFVVLLSKNGSGDLGGSSLWSNAFLPAVHRGVTFRSQGDSILHLSSPTGVTNRMQQERIAAIQQFNQLRMEQQPDSEIASRIASYELAYRMQVAAPDMLDLSGESAETLERYGVDDKVMGTYGRNCLMARRLVERGVRFVQLYHYTWDDHANLNVKLKENCQITEQPTATLIHDLRERGLLEDTLVVWGGEFGRTPMAEVRRGSSPGKEGRDHHPFSFTMLMAGGGVKAGFTLGDTDEIGYHVTEQPVHVHDIQATILHCLGVDHERLTFRHQGRDFRLTDVAGNVVRDILA
ncbi:MAG: DUF1501 domain-containing protein [Pirellulaceae bacterium]|nr:DUF1501 domain-containing protein [Pirellulaceae bacterium]